MTTPAPATLRQQRPVRADANPHWVSAWEGLLERQPHLSAPELAASALRIPEAGLMALRQGQDVTRLLPRLDDLLQGLPDWGKVTLTARNRLGAAVVETAVRNVQATPAGPGGSFGIMADAVQIQVATQAVSTAFLFEDRGNPACSHSVQVYDPAGDLILRVGLGSAEAQRKALPHLLAHSDSNAGTGWRAGSIGSAAVAGFPGWCAIVSTLNRPDAARRAMAAAVAALPEMDRFRLVLEAKSMAFSYLGAVEGHLGPTDASASSGCRLSARPTSVNHGFVCQAPDGVNYLRFHDGDGCGLSLWPQSAAPAAKAWIDRLALPAR